MFLRITEVTQDQQNRYNSPRGITCTSTEKASHEFWVWKAWLQMTTKVIYYKWDVRMIAIGWTNLIRNALIIHLKYEQSRQIGHIGSF